MRDQRPKLEFKTTESLSAQAVALVRQGHEAAAEQLIQTAYTEQPNLMDGYAQLGGICRELKLWEQARFWMERDYSAGRMSLGWQLRYADVLAELNLWDEAEKVVASAYEEYPNATDGYARLGAAFIRRNQWDEAREWMERDVEAKRISPFWRLHYARVLGAFGESEKAEDLVDAVLSDAAQEKTSADVLLQACETLLYLNPNRDVSKILDDGFSRYPEQTPRILAKKAEIKQRTAITRWLLSLSNRIPKKNPAINRECVSENLYKPDWAAVVRDYDCALAAGANMEENNDLQQMILAQLFHGQELRQAGNQDESAKALRKCLQSVSPALSPETSNPIAEAIHAFQSGEKSKQVATDQIMNLLADEKYLLSSKQWLALNDILVWHGFFRCGYRAWDRSIQQAYVEADTTRKDVGSQQHAFRAAMIVADYDRAAHYLEFLQDPNAKAYLDLHQGRIEEAQAYWESLCSPQEERFAEFIKNKSVSVVGPVPTGTSDGSVIDRHDVVIRTCYTGLSPKNQHEFGTRTDVSNYADSWVRTWRTGQAPRYLSHLLFYSIGRRAPLCRFITDDVSRGKAHPLRDDGQSYYKSPMAAQRTIRDIIQFAPQRITLYKTTLYASQTVYHSDYKTVIPVARNNRTEVEKITARAAVLFAHDYLCQINDLRNLYRAGTISVDDACRRVLEMSNEEYMSEMEVLHG